MGELEGLKAAWGYVEGGMGAVSAAIAKSAQSYDAHLFTDKVLFTQLTITLFVFSRLSRSS